MKLQLRDTFRKLAETVGQLKNLPITLRGNMLPDLMADGAPLAKKGFLSVAFLAVHADPKAVCIGFEVETKKGRRPAVISIGDFERAIASNDSKVTLEIWNAVEEARNALHESGQVLLHLPHDTELEIVHS